MFFKKCKSKECNVILQTSFLTFLLLFTFLELLVMRNLAFKPKDHGSLLIHHSEPYDSMNVKKSLPKIPSIVQLPKVALEPPKESSQPIALHVVERSNEPFSISSHTLQESKSYHELSKESNKETLNQLYLSHIDTLQTKLLETQQKLMLEMNHIQGNLNDSLRNQLNSSREDSMKYKTQQDHVSFLKDVLRNVQDQLHGLVNQQNMTRDHISKVSEWVRQKSYSDQTAFAETYKKVDESKEMQSLLLKELSLVRLESSQIKSSTEAQLKELKTQMDEFKTSLTNLKNNTDILSIYISKLDSRLSGSAQTADGNLTKVGQVLFDYAAFIKKVEDDALKNMKSEMSNELEALKTSLHQKQLNLSQEIQQERNRISGFENVNAISSKLIDLDGWMKSQLKDMTHQRHLENQELLKTVVVLKNSILNQRSRESTLLDEIQKQVFNAKLEFNEQLSNLKREIQTELDKKTKSSSVMIL